MDAVTYCDRNNLSYDEIIKTKQYAKKGGSMYRNGGRVGQNVRGIAYYITSDSAGDDYRYLSGSFLSKEEFDKFYGDDAILDFYFNVNVEYDWQLEKAIYQQMLDEEVREEGIHIIGYKISRSDNDDIESNLPYDDDEEYAEGGEIQDWMEEALASLIEETGYDDLEITIVSNDGNEFYATDENAEYRVFKTEDDAEEVAVEQVREDMEESPESFYQDFLLQHIDGRSFFESALDEMNLSYAEDIKSEDDERYANRLIAEMVENGIMDEDDALSGNAEELADLYIEDFANLMTEEQLNEGNDGFDYFVSNFGLEYTMKLVIDNNLIDIDEASKDAVISDGIGHFLSSYDGETLYLSNDYVAYRVN
jgi:hypothetical protein